MHNISKATIILSNRCNLNCSYCFVGRNGSPCLNIARIKSFIRWFIAQPINGECKKLNFSGGEPFQNFVLLREAILFFKRHNTNKQTDIETIPTNGTVLTQEILNFVREENLRVSFSLDGNRISNVARSFKNGENCFDLVWHNLGKFRDFAGEPPLVKMTVLPSNVKHLYSNVKFMVENGFYKVWPNPGIFKVKWARGDVDIFVSEYKKVLRFFLKNRLSGRQIFLIPVDNVIINSGKGKLRERDFFCGLGEFPILSFDGNIYACHSALTEAGGLKERFKVGETTNSSVRIDLAKMRVFQKYSIWEEHNLRNKDHFLASLFRRRFCFSVSEKGEELEKEYIENVLDMHLRIYELSVDLFNKYGSLLRDGRTRSIPDMPV